MAEALPDFYDSDFSDDKLTILDISFNRATAHVRKITDKLDSNQLLNLYGLFKQGTEGMCDTPKPSWYDARGRKKWEAWRNIGDMPGEEAKERYVALVRKYDPEWSAEQYSAGAGEGGWNSVSTLQHCDDCEVVLNELSLIDAAREDWPKRITMLLTQNPNLKYEKDSDGLTALHWAADRDNFKSLKAALDGGCPIDAKDNSGQTALHYAVTCGQVESTKVLINAGASLLEDEDGKTPLDLAESDEIREILEGAK